MRIAYVCADFGIPIHGTKGASIHVRELTRALVREGHEVIVLTPRRGGTPPPGYDVPVIEIGPEVVDAELRRHISGDEAGGEPLANEVRGLLYASTMRHRATALLHEWRPDIIYERHALPGLAGRAIANELGIPHLLEINAPLAREQARHRTVHLRSTASALEARSIVAADAVIVVSAALARWALEAGVERSRIHMLSNGVDPDRFATAADATQLRRRLHLDGKTPVVGFVGTLKPWHDVAGVLRAAGMLRRRGVPLRLLIVGEGPMRPQLERMAGEEGLAAETRFTGAVAHDAIPGYLRAMDAAVVPYASTPGDSYFSPLKLFEYGAAARPVIAADIGEIAHCVRDRETGLLYPSGNAETLSSGLHHILSDRAGAARMGEALRDHVTTEHTWTGNARTVADIAQRLCASSLIAARAGS